MPLRRDAGRVLPGWPVKVSIDHPPMPACAPLSLSRCGPGLRSAPTRPEPQHSVFRCKGCLPRQEQKPAHAVLGRTKLLRQPLIVFVPKAVCADVRGVGAMDNCSLPAHGSAHSVPPVSCHAPRALHRQAGGSSRQSPVEEDLPASGFNCVQQRLLAICLLHKLDYG